MSNVDSQFNKFERMHMKALERRMDYLTSRINNYTGKSDSRDRAERSAIRWALDTIRNTEIIDE